MEFFDRIPWSIAIIGALTLVWRRALIDLPVQQASRQSRRDERHTKSMIFLVAFMSRQNRIRLRLCVDFGATGH